MKQIVIMPGGFHPFHAGHYSLYQAAQEQFPDAEVFVAATNDQKERPFPFSIKEKLARVAGVDPSHFVQVKSPFMPKEITQNFNPEEDVLIFVRSQKDRNENPKPGGTKKDGTPSYFQPYTGKNLKPFGKQAYITYLPTITFGPGITSATEIRNVWPSLNDRQKTALVMSLYPATQQNQPLAKNVVKLLDAGMGGQSPVDEADTLAEPNDTKIKAQGRLVMGRGDGPIIYDGKTVNPGDPEYEAAEQALIQQTKTSADIEKSFTQTNPPIRKKPKTESLDYLPEK